MVKLCVLLILLSNITFLYSQENVNYFKKFSLDLNVFYINRLVDNGISATDNALVTDNFNHVINNINNLPSGAKENPKSYLGLNDSKVLFSLGLNYSIDRSNYIGVSAEFNYRQNYLLILDNDFLSTNYTDYGDLLVNFMYFKSNKLYKKVNLRTGLGIGVSINDISDYNTIFKSNGLSSILISKNGKSIYEFSNNNSISFDEKYRNLFDVNFALKFNVDFNSKKDYNIISIMGGLNIQPFNYLGVDWEIYNSNNILIKSGNFDFKNINYYIGVGHTFKWKKEKSSDINYNQQVLQSLY